MKSLVVSDLHFEFHRDGGLSMVDSLSDADVCLFPGDLSNAAGIWDGLLLMLRKYAHVVFVFGNHEFYGSSIHVVRRKIQGLQRRLSALPGTYGQLHVLDNSTCELNGRRFVGTTLWFRDDPGNAAASPELNDFYQIKNAWRSISRENAEALQFLEETVTTGDIVLTHHLPAEDSVHPQWKGNNLNRFFLCDVGPLIQERQPSLWLHGHTHVTRAYHLGQTEVLCNPFGYAARDENPEFNPRLLVEV